MSNTFTQLQQALAPSVAMLVSSFGVTVDVRPRSATRLNDGETTESWTVDASGVGLKAMVELLSATAAQRLYGMQTSVVGRMVLANVGGVLPTVNVRDAIRVTSGPYAGAVFLADADGLADAIGASLVVPLSALPQGVTVP